MGIRRKSKRSLRSTVPKSYRWSIQRNTKTCFMMPRRLLMAANSHALLGPSSAKRWLSCTPSARLTESIEDTESVFAAEGTDAHALCEYKLRKSVGLPVPDVLPKLEYYSKEMDDYADDYVSFILELYEEAKAKCKDPLVLVEQYLDLEKYVPESF